MEVSEDNIIMHSMLEAFKVLWSGQGRVKGNECVRSCTCHCTLYMQAMS